MDPLSRESPVPYRTGSLFGQTQYLVFPGVPDPRETPHVPALWAGRAASPLRQDDADSEQQIRVDTLFAGDDLEAGVGAAGLLIELETPQLR